MKFGKMLPRLGIFASSIAARLPLSTWDEIQAIEGEARSQPAPPLAAFSLLRQSSFDGRW